jgi:hypothetical protein
MAAFRTLLRLQCEWNSYAETGNSEKLAEAMHFILAEFEKTGGRSRTTRQSWMELPVETVRASALLYEDCPKWATKMILADFLATKVRCEQRQHRRELQEQLQALSAGTVPTGIVTNMIDALDTYVW